MKIQNSRKLPACGFLVENQRDFKIEESGYIPRIARWSSSCYDKANN